MGLVYRRDHLENGDGPFIKFASSTGQIDSRAHPTVHGKTKGHACSAHARQRIDALDKLPTIAQPLWLNEEQRQKIAAALRGSGASKTAVDTPYAQQIPPNVEMRDLPDGLKREIAFHKGQPSILDAASAAGLEVPFSCTSGVCGTCRAKLVSGEVRMERNFALDPHEVADVTLFLPISRTALWMR